MGERQGRKEKEREGRKRRSEGRIIVHIQMEMTKSLPC